MLPSQLVAGKLGRRSFTRVELLVVMTVGAILMALIVQMLEASRQAARRMQAENNLRNLGLRLREFRTDDSGDSLYSASVGETNDTTLSVQAVAGVLAMIAALTASVVIKLVVRYFNRRDELSESDR